MSAANEELPCSTHPEEPISSRIPVEDMLGIGVPLGIRTVSRVAVGALRNSDVVISYCTEDQQVNSGHPLRIQRRP
jgi:hypothetical protein